ncbi:MULTISPECIES: hypothetical protein [unclassified Streptomyces]|uniref:hypothetical protein n=1 Tax=unclassified Streptomyces TaxID=2593676 RepID=UPI0006AE10FA|nr:MULTISPECIES: hypothetical protein [unclassified Streptomyces]KOX21988.1 membrane protein [Streptomyces sp. NRRL F-6491]KOX41679.1 membrane protein [Streptomyces sp. NRRL F-6492]
MLAETICSAVSAAGLGIAAIAAYRKRFLSAARIAAYALVPLGLVMTGAVAWIAGTAFSPVAWAGFGLLGLAWVLFLSTRAVERRRAGRARPAVAEADPRAAAPAAPAAPRAVTGKPRAAAEPAGDDFGDIEAILKKHGI